MTKRVTIIEETGVNHNGDLDLAVELVDRAAKAGADAVKFQTFKANETFTVDANQKFKVKIDEETAYLCTYQDK